MESFYTPSRQSSAAILVIVFDTFKRLIKQFWPILLLLIFGTSQESSTTDRIVYMISVLAAFSGLISIISYFNYYYHIEGKTLVVQKGILQKSKTNIPFDRIQTINIEQELIHRMLGVVKLEIDTAGSQNKELTLKALTEEKAQALRSYILESKDQMPLVEQERREEEVLMQLDPVSLIKTGLVENHLRSAFIVFAFGLWALDQLREFGLEKQLSQFEKGWVAFASSLANVLGLFMVFIGLAILISVLRIFIQYYNLKLLREPNGFRLSYGLINRRQVSAKDSKTQIISWSQNLLQKKIDLFKLRLRQAGSREVGNKKSITIHGCKPSNVEEILDHLIGKNKEDFQHVKTPVNVHYLLYHGRNLLIVGLPILIGLIWLKQPEQLIGAIILLGGFLITLFRRYKKAGFSLTRELLKVNGGAFGEKTAILYNYKIQAVQIRQSYYQRRRSLANLRIGTAAGDIVIPFIKVDTANAIADYLLYKAESSKQSWM